MQVALIAHETDLEGFRAEARRLLAAQAPPEEVQWRVETPATGERADDLFAASPSAGESVTESGAPPTAATAASAGNADDLSTADDGGTDPVPTAHAAHSAPPARDDGTPSRPAPLTDTSHIPRAATAIVPASFLRLCEQVVLHSDAQRFALLYRLLWRLVHEPGLRHDPLDADMLRAQHMAQAVRRDMHKMKAFVRFRPVHDAAHGAEPVHVAWFEPYHHIVEAMAPWFVERFTQMQWAILTPRRSVQWNGRDLQLGPGAEIHDAPPADAGEQLWLTYYKSIFNPARLKLKAMQKEMPKKYWANLPEAQLIAPLAAEARARTGTMIENAPTEPARRIVRGAPLKAPPQSERSTIRIESFDDLKAAADRCRECPIGEFATQAVVGEGNREARVMFVGEQPGDQEDLKGRPFVGPAGQLFDRALGAVGIARGDIYLSNAVKHFKFELRGKRRIHKTPTQREAAACLHWLEDEIALVKPQALVALGATGARALMGRQVAVMAERGQWLDRPDGLKVLITLHPSALLRMPPELQDQAFDDFVADLKKAEAVMNATAA